MQTTKLGILFENLTAREILAFERFLLSPYFNEHKGLVRLFRYLQYCKNEGQLSACTNASIFNHLYKGEKFDDARVRHLKSDLVKLIEEFLVIHHFRKDKSGFQLSLMERYNERGLNKHFNGAKLLTGRYLEEQGIKNAEYHYRLYRSESELYLNFVAQRKRDFAESIEKSGWHLDTFYFAEKLRLFCVMLNNESILGAAYKIPMFNEVLGHLESNPYHDVPAVRIYYTILQTFLDVERGEEWFRKAWKLLQEHSHQFSITEANDMHVYVLNYCIRRINQSGDYLRTSLDIYQSMIDKDIIIRQDYLSPWTYKNIVVIALRLGEQDWVGEFMENFKDRISPEYRQNAYFYNLAYFNFYKKDYDKVLELLQKVEYNDVFYNLDSKALLLKSYYELREFEALYSLMDSFRIFLRRKKKISDRHRKNFSNLIRFTRKASRIMPGQEKRIKALLHQIDSTEQVADKPWVREKVASLL